jgi:type IV secretion system protein VirD4
MPRSSISTSRALFPFVIDRRLTAFHASYSPSQRTRCRCIASSRRLIRRYVPWISPFTNANMDHIEHSDDQRVELGSSCLFSIAALREVHQKAEHSIYVGYGTHGWSWAGVQRSTLVLGPPRSGKTSSLVIPNILLSAGPVVSTSTKPDVMRTTAFSRQREGWAFLYDPSGDVECPRGVERIGWSPLTTAARWDSAVQTADAMVMASRLGLPEGADHHWSERAAALLSGLLHAAAVEQLPMTEVLRWIDRHHGASALEILSATAGEDAPPTDLLAGIVATDPREQSGIWSTASGVLAAYRTGAALSSTSAPPLSPDAFCEGPHTLYICSTGRQQRQFAPLVVAALGDVRDAAYVRARDGMPGPPVLLALDEVANIAPIPDLPAMVSEGAGQGLLVLACLQDLSQARARWGRAAEGFLSLFGTTVVLPGIADTATLRDLSALAGEREVASATLTRSVGPWGRIRPSTSVGTTRQAALSVDAIARGRPGRALVLGPDKTVRSVELTPFHARRPWRDLAAVEHARERRSDSRDRVGYDTLSRGL